MLAAADISPWMTDGGAFDDLSGLRDLTGRLVPYDELAQREQVIEGAGFTVHVAALEDIIAAKEYTDRPMDREALPELWAIRDAQGS